MELKYRVALSRVARIGSARTRLLDRHFGEGGMERAWSATRAELAAAGLDQAAITELHAARRRIDPDAEMERLERQRIAALTWHDPGYPWLLREVPDPPPVLYVRGSLEAGDDRSVTVVGTRKVTAYGREVASTLAADLARYRVTVVSGLARGVDSVAHRAALETGGRTVAVLANGLDTVYPPEHRELAGRVAGCGALVSEYPPGVRPVGQNFPRRNRIVSGLGLGTLVIEAGRQSGAQHTVQHALEQGREVFAVPGSILSPASRGTNRLIQEGAKLVSSVEDVLEELNLNVLGHQVPMEEAPPPADADAGILSHLGREPLHVDELVRRSGLAMGDLNSQLMLLELRGLVREVGSRTYVRSREVT